MFLRIYYSFFIVVGFINLWLLKTYNIPCQRELFYMVIILGTFYPLLLRSIHNYEKKDTFGIVLTGLSFILFILIFVFETNELKTCTDILICKYRNEGVVF